MKKRGRIALASDHRIILCQSSRFCRSLLFSRLRPPSAFSSLSLFLRLIVYLLNHASCLIDLQPALFAQTVNKKKRTKTVFFLPGKMRAWGTGMIAMLRCAPPRVRLWIASSGPVLPARGRHPSRVGRSIVTSTLLVRSGSRHSILPEMGTATPALIFFLSSHKPSPEALSRRRKRSRETAVEVGSILFIYCFARQ